LTKDIEWQKHIAYRWEPEAIKDVMSQLPGIWLQPPDGQSEYRIGYFIDTAEAPRIREIKKHLRQNKVHANVIIAYNRYLDIVPVRASKGKALRFFADKWGFSIDRILVVGASGSDEDMLRGNTLGVVVGNHTPELNKLKDRYRIYFAKNYYAWGIIEGIEYYDFMGDIRIPEPQVNNSISKGRAS
ncbi:MAG: HAD family hydrolase, partial [Nitrospirae bacterium]